MKKCSYCGAEYPDDATVCAIDQTCLDDDSLNARSAPAGSAPGMRIILSSPNPGEIDQLKAMLESAGIACFTRNEFSAGLSPEIPISESTPELWIQDGRNLAEALEIKKAWKASAPVVGSDWVCPKCGETSEPQFDSCWKCGAARPV